MVLKIPKNTLFSLLIIIPIHRNYLTSGHYITKRNIQKSAQTWDKGSHKISKIDASYLSKYYDDFGPGEGYKHVLVRRGSVLPSPLQSWCSLLPKSPTRYVSIRCKVSGDFPINENECNIYHHCWKQLNSTKRCCPPGHHFDHVKRKCRPIEKARCSSSKTNTTVSEENYFYVNKINSGNPINIPTWPGIFPGVLPSPFWYPSYPNGFLPQPALFGYAPVPMLMPMFMGVPFYPNINPYQTLGYSTGQIVGYSSGLPAGNQLSQAQMDISAGDTIVKPSLFGPVQVRVNLPEENCKDCEEGTEIRPNQQNSKKGIDLFPMFHEHIVANMHSK